MCLSAEISDFFLSEYLKKNVIAVACQHEMWLFDLDLLNKKIMILSWPKVLTHWWSKYSG